MAKKETFYILVDADFNWLNNPEYPYELYQFPTLRQAMKERKNLIEIEGIVDIGIEKVTTEPILIKETKPRSKRHI